MSASTIRIITGLVLIIHGIGHAMAFFPALNIFSNEKWHHRSWLLSGFLGDTVSRALVIILFGVALIGFIAAGLGLFGWLVPHSAWQILAINLASLIKSVSQAGAVQMLAQSTNNVRGSPASPSPCPGVTCILPPPSRVSRIGSIP